MNTENEVPFDTNYSGRFSRTSITEEPVFDASTSTNLEFSLEESTILPNVEEFLLKKHLDPWRRLSALEHDCILLVEFSELEGPRPLICIPDSPGMHFERNDFSVWLMTADYQASNHRNGPFCINEDIQMLLSNEEQGVHTYAHHFTLFDIEARGYVRPFCITYVTPEAGKLTRLFDMLRTEFSSILRSVKTCNRRLFRKALTEAVEALNVIETQAISSYYELYYDGKLVVDDSVIKSAQSSPSHSSKQQQPDVLNTRYRRLHRELTLAQSAVADDLRNKLRHAPLTSTVSGNCGSHVVSMDQWINSLRRGEGVENHKKILKEFHELCPCIFEEFQRQIRSIWMKYRHWNSSMCWLLEPRNNYGAKMNLGSIPLIYLPVAEGKDDSNEDSKIRNKEKMNQNRFGLFSTTEVDTLHDLIYSKHFSKDDSEQRRLLLTIAPHLRYFLYPILTGQLLITYGSDLRRQLITDLIQKLKIFIPTIFASPRCSLWNETTALPESVLEDYKILGLRVGQKEKISDFINDDMKRYLALLDLNNDIFHVADYKGDILNRLVSRASSHKSDWTLMLAILSTISEYGMLAYLLCYFTPTSQMNVNSPVNGTNGFRNLQKWMNGSAKGKDSGNVLKLQNGDLKIAKYFVELLKMQDFTDEAANAGTGDYLSERYENEFLLDYEPAQLHKL